ncbi:MAG: hypothetical protein QXF76_04015 [Candidatus Anstonellales archaeon]
MAKLKLNQKEILEGVLAALTVNNAPILLKQLGLPLDSFTSNIGAAALSYIIGALTKKPVVTNVGISLALANIINEIALEPLLNSVNSNKNNLKSNLSNYAKLKDYVPKPVVVRSYKSIYS